MLSTLVTNNKGIKGIAVDSTGYLISRYADDTTIILSHWTIQWEYWIIMQKFV